MVRGVTDTINKQIQGTKDSADAFRFWGCVDWGGGSVNNGHAIQVNLDTSSVCHWRRTNMIGPNAYPHHRDRGAALIEPASGPADKSGLVVCVLRRVKV